MHFLLNFFKGIAIGAGAILPGISSGVLCMVFGIYESLLNCFLNFFKNIKYNFKFLFPIILGVFFGIVLFGNFLKSIFYAYPVQTKSLFIGLIIGSIPELIKKANSKTKFRLRYLFFLFFSFCIGLFLVYIERRFELANSNCHFSPVYLIFSGFLMSAGVIIPGVSSTLILMILGIYDSYLLSVSSVYLPFLFPLSIGLFIGCIICMKILTFLLKKYYSQTFFSIIGFTIGSISVLYPKISSPYEVVLCILCIFLGIFVVNSTIVEKT